MVVEINSLLIKSLVGITNNQGIFLMYQVLEQLQTKFSSQDQAHHSPLITKININSNTNLQIINTIINQGPMLILDLSHHTLRTKIYVKKVSSADGGNAISIIQMAET